MAYEITNKAGYVLVRLLGQLNMTDLTEVTKPLDEADKMMETSPHRLIDVSEVDGIQLNFTAIHQLTENRRAVKLKNNVKSALVARTPVQFGFARMFQTLNSQSQIEVRIFSDADSALRWITGQTGPGDQPA